jgi:4-amino-4-deoxy-L-arabinose transferase-like glycosyltransferase
VWFNTDEVRVAWALRDGLGYAFDHFELFGEPPTPGAFFPPAYVYNVFFLDRLFGTNPALAIENLLLSLGVSYCLYVLARRHFGRNHARITLVISVLYIPFFSRLTHGSPVYFKMFFTVLLVLLLSRAWQTRSYRLFLISGVVGGFLALSMPDVLMYVAMVAVAIVAYRKRFRVGIGHAAVFLIAAAAVIAPWTVRNWVGFDRFCVISTNGGMNFYLGNNTETTHEVELPAIARLDEKLGGELARSDEFVRDKILYREAFRFISTQPVDVLVNMLKLGLYHWGFRPEILNALKARSKSYAGFPVVYVWSYVISYSALLLMAVGGLWMSRRRFAELSPVFLVFAYSTLVTMLFVVQTKQRLVKVEPFLILFAAVALGYLIAKGSTGDSRR